MTKGRKGSESWGVICMDGSSLSERTKRGRGRLEEALLTCAAQKLGPGMTSTMAWSLVLLTLLSHCTGDLMQG